MTRGRRGWNMHSMFDQSEVPRTNTHSSLYIPSQKRSTSVYTRKLPRFLCFATDGNSSRVVDTFTKFKCKSQDKRAISEKVSAQWETLSAPYTTWRGDCVFFYVRGVCFAGRFDVIDLHTLNKFTNASNMLMEYDRKVYGPQLPWGRSTPNL